MSEKTASVFRYLAYIIEIVLVFVLSSTPRLLPELWGAKPCLLLCIAVTISIFEREIPSMVFGILCGVLLDLGYSNAIGVFTVSLTLLCFVIGFASNNLIRANFQNFLITSFLVTVAVFMLYFLFEYVFKSYPDPWIFFRDNLISRMAQTFVCSVIFYFINRFFYRMLSSEEAYQ